MTDVGLYRLMCKLIKKYEKAERDNDTREINLLAQQIAKLDEMIRKND